MKYRVDISFRARKQMASLPRIEQQRLDKAIQALATNSRPPGCKKMAGASNEYRIRVGDYRVVYDILDQVLVVRVIKVGHRKHIYRD